MAETPKEKDQMDEDNDNKSVGTAHAENRNNSYTNEPIEYVAKFTF